MKFLTVLLGQIRWLEITNGAVENSGTKSLKFAACFTSVAGRFGNGGQTDYAALTAF